MLFITAAFLITATSCKKSTDQFALVSPASNSTNIPTTQLFTCNTISGALTYSFVFNGTALATSSVSSATVTLQPSTTYTWYVVAGMSDGSTRISNTWSFSTASTISGVLTLVSPPDLSTGVCITPTFTWIAQTGVTTYDLYIATNPSFTHLITTTQVTGTSYTLPAGLLGSLGSYYWRMAPSGSSTFTDYNSFRVVDVPTPQSPAQGATGIATNSASFSWSSMPCATTYLLELSQDNTFSTIEQTHTVTGNTYTASGLHATSHYYWRVKVTGDLATGAVSDFHT